MATYGLTAEGFTRPTLEEIKAEWEEDLRAEIDATLDLSPDQPFGQFVGIASQREAMIGELLETLVNMFNPNAGEGAILENVCAISGTKRESAKKSTVTLNCNVNDNFSASAGAMMANVSGNASARFVNKSAVGPLTPAGVYPIEFEATEYGPTVANATTLTVITAPVSGWNSCTNPVDADLGSNREEDPDLRVRREDEIAAAGSSTVDSLRADVLQVEGVKQAYVFENVTLVTDGNGVPGKAVEVVVYDGTTPEADDEEVAETIWKGKVSGGETYGSITTEIVDSFGETQTVKWSRATVLLVYLNFENVVIDPNAFPADGVQAIKDAVAAKAAKLQNLGVDVIALKLKSAAESVPGVIDVPTLKLGTAPSPSGTANLTVTGRQIAEVDTARITVTTTEGTP